MPALKIPVEEFIGLAKKHPVIDVRSPGEYNHAHIPAAHSLPLFTDEERKIVGTVYKQQSREAAIKIGLDFFGPKMRILVEQVEAIAVNKIILVYCWRGGMRSGAVSWLLDLYGFKVYTLAGGYKKFRRYTLDTFNASYSFKMIGGYTGSGKTELLKQLEQRGQQVIDLEGIARHKGSAFGNIGMPEQPTQEMFENLLALELRQQSEGHIWLEDESQRIGHVNIPNELWRTMRRSPVYFVDIPFEERLLHLVEEYGSLDRQRMIDAIGRIKEKLGGLNAKNAIQYLEEGNIIESFRILLKYYDKYYFKSLHNREALNSLLHTIECKTVIPENASRLLALPYQYEKT